MRERGWRRGLWTAALTLAIGGFGACATGPIGPDDEFGFDDDAFAEWDEDNSAFLDMNEFESGLEDEGVFETVDEDRSGALDEGEFAELGVDDVGFNEIDEDESGFVEEDELSAGLFNTWDEDNNSLITETEFGIG